MFDGEHFTFSGQSPNLLLYVLSSADCPSFFRFCLNHLFYSLCTDDLVVTGLNNRDFYNKTFPSLFILLN